MGPPSYNGLGFINMKYHSGEGEKKVHILYNRRKFIYIYFRDRFGEINVSFGARRNHQLTVLFKKERENKTNVQRDILLQDFTSLTLLLGHPTTCDTRQYKILTYIYQFAKSKRFSCVLQ